MTGEPRPDPAGDAAATPEGADPTDPVHVVGIGPGDPDYLAPRGREHVAGADVVFGFETVVDYVRGHIDGDVFPCGYEDEATVLSQFAARVDAGARGVAVAMGDPNVSGYQFLGRVERAVDRPVRVVPGISSVQVAASRARTPIEETTVVTLHKRGPVEADLDRLDRDVGDRHLLVLPRPFDWMPGAVAGRLVEGGAPTSLDALVFERLTHDDEAVTRSTLGDLARVSGAGEDTAEEARFSALSILAVRRWSR
jgi:cobalt-precorrin-7 (C5)-methyltransferase